MKDPASNGLRPTSGVQRPTSDARPSTWDAGRGTSDLKNIGPTSAQWLRNVGILTAADLAHFGSVIAFRIVKEAGYPASLNLLYALEAALRDIDWRELDDTEKRRLREEAGA